MIIGVQVVTQGGSPCNVRMATEVRIIVIVRMALGVVML